MIPIGRGTLRELIIGDRRDRSDDRARHDHQQPRTAWSASTSQSASACRPVVALAETLRAHDALENTIIVAAAADEAAPIKYMAPYAGCARAEHFIYNGGHALVVYDDLTKHAYAYRQMSLLLRRPPGREAYPATCSICTAPARARGQATDSLGGGSMTALPIIETQAGDVSAYIPTRDLGLRRPDLLEAESLQLGVRPAINVGIFRLAVGGNAQIGSDEEGCRPAQARALAVPRPRGFAQFGSDLDA